MPKDVQDIDQNHRLNFRKPIMSDGPAIWSLVRDCKPLDENSMYCNLVQADHFRDTCVVAERDGRVVGWISGHLIPGRNALFIWQVAVGPSARGWGLGRRMLTHLIARSECAEADRLHTTITRDNEASWGLFRGLARRMGTALSHQPHYTRDDHFGGRHATEHRVTIALPQAQPQACAA